MNAEPEHPERPPVAFMVLELDVTLLLVRTHAAASTSDGVVVVAQPGDANVTAPAATAPPTIKAEMAFRICSPFLSAQELSPKKSSRRGPNSCNAMDMQRSAMGRLDCSQRQKSDCFLCRNTSAIGNS